MGFFIFIGLASSKPSRCPPHTLHTLYMGARPTHCTLFALYMGARFPSIPLNLPPPVPDPHHTHCIHYVLVTSPPIMHTVSPTRCTHHHTGARSPNHTHLVTPYHHSRPIHPHDTGPLPGAKSWPPACTRPQPSPSAPTPSPSTRGRAWA